MFEAFLGLNINLAQENLTKGLRDGSKLSKFVCWRHSAGFVSSKTKHNLPAEKTTAHMPPIGKYLKLRKQLEYFKKTFSIIDFKKSKSF